MRSLGLSESTRKRRAQRAKNLNGIHSALHGRQVSFFSFHSTWNTQNSPFVRAFDWNSPSILKVTGVPFMYKRVCCASAERAMKQTGPNGLQYKSKLSDRLNQYAHMFRYSIECFGGTADATNCGSSDCCYRERRFAPNWEGENGNTFNRELWNRCKENLTRLSHQMIVNCFSCGAIGNAERLLRWSSLNSLSVYKCGGRARAMSLTQYHCN